MWIRSQSKKALLNVNQVVINNTKEESEYYIHGYSERGIDILGVYSTQEKAFAVLDEIQEKIEYPYPSKIMPSIGTNCYHLIENNKFYQMPQDDEVEVWS